MYDIMMTDLSLSMLYPKIIAEETQVKGDCYSNLVIFVAIETSFLNAIIVV